MQYQQNQSPSQTATKKYIVSVTDEELCNGCRKCVRIYRTDARGQDSSLDLHVDIPRGSLSGFSRWFPGCGSYIGCGTYQDVLVEAVRTSPVPSISNNLPHCSAPSPQYGGESTTPSHAAHSTCECLRSCPPSTSTISEAAPLHNRCCSHMPSPGPTTQPSVPYCFSEDRYRPPLRVYKAGDVSLEYASDGAVEIQIRDYFNVMMETDFCRTFVLVDQTPVIVRFSDFGIIGGFVEKRRYFAPNEKSMLSGSVRVLFIADVVPGLCHCGCAYENGH